MRLDERKSTLLQLIIDEYISTAEPVGSKGLVEKYHLDLSSATVRNEMSLLEELGYLIAPHPSAGRIPTEKGYAYYLEHCLRIKHERRDADRLRECFQEVEEDQEQALKELARVLVDLSGETVIVAFDSHSSYYTGVSNLFRKPDFADMALLHSLSDIVDQFDQVIGEVFDTVVDEPQVWMGQHNPFGKEMTSIVLKYYRPGRQVGVLGILGPLRMNYAKNIGLIEEVKTILTIL